MQCPERLRIVDGCSWTLDGWTDKMARSGVSALNLTLAAYGSGFLDAIANIEHARAVVRAASGRLRAALNVGDLERAHNDGAVSVVFNFQNGQPIEDRVQHVETFYSLGVRSIQLTYNERNMLGDGCLEPENSGLSALGRDVIREMNALGILVDLSHAGERTSIQALEVSDKPCVFSHSNPRSRADNPRNIQDYQIKACADTGGVVGVCGWGPMLWTGSERAPNVEDFVDNIEYIADLVGVDFVGVASDSTTSMRDDHIRAHAAEVDSAYAPVTGDFIAKFGPGLDFRYPVNVTKLPSVADALTSRGWNAEDVRKVMGENFVRVWSEVWNGGLP